MGSFFGKYSRKIFLDFQDWGPTLRIRPRFWGKSRNTGRIFQKLRGFWPNGAFLDPFFTLWRCFLRFRRQIVLKSHFFRVMYPLESDLRGGGPSWMPGSCILRFCLYEDQTKTIVESGPLGLFLGFTVRSCVGTV